MSTLTVEAVTFEMVFEEHRTRILRILRKRLDPSFERRFQPEDVLQQVYLRAESALGTPAGVHESFPLAVPDRTRLSLRRSEETRRGQAGLSPGCCLGRPVFGRSGRFVHVAERGGLAD